MRGLLNTLRWLAAVVWVGGAMFFAFVVAPVAFGSLPNAHEAGIVVRGTINALHQMGLVCGLVLVASTLLLWGKASGPRRLYVAQIVMMLAMMVVTVYSQMMVLPAMERDRVQAGGTIAPAGGAVAGDEALRADFERLHAMSERLEGFVLLCGLGLVVLMAWEPHPERRGLTVAGLSDGVGGLPSDDYVEKEGEVVTIRHGGG